MSVDKSERLFALIKSDWAHLAKVSGRAELPLRPWHVVSPRFMPVVLIRLAHSFHRHRLGPFAKLVSVFNFFVFGIEVPTSLSIGGGLLVPHTVGTVLGAAKIGKNVTIFHQVTLGAAIADFQFDPNKRPVIEDGVTIGVGAKVLGGILLGQGCVIGANAVVLASVPSGATAVGVPARIITAPGSLS